MAKIQIVGGRRVSVDAPKLTPAQKLREGAKLAKEKEAAHKLPAVRVKNKLTGLSLRQLVRATPPYIKSNANEVTIKALKEATTKGGLPGVRAKVWAATSRSRTVYDSSFVGKEKDIPISKQKHVLASCSCDWFWSHCEYALHHWGSAVIKYSNGEPATVTNPQNHPLLCKHLVRLAEEIVSEGM